MEIIANKVDDTLELKVIGRLDTITSNQLEAELKKVDKSVDLLIFDFSDLEYLTSVGIRIIVSAHKMMMKQGKLVVRNLNDEVSEVLEVTGILDLLNVE